MRGGVIDASAPGVVVVGVVVVGAEPGAVGAALGMGRVVGLMVVADAEPEAVGAALGMGWIGHGVRVVEHRELVLEAKIAPGDAHALDERVRRHDRQALGCLVGPAGPAGVS